MYVEHHNLFKVMVKVNQYKVGEAKGTETGRTPSEDGTGLKSCVA